ncbi:MAG: chemotaxis protein CheW [Phenylobacterium sp.]|uniref:chemotaxis protein CheW n=1 Tax=Phenylobacterium sp. TaxID=1871053 RepID=UPI002732E950|nr:chemotaxis protein CheW [Phenylobacterium sp.]MDP1643310.1 chemotaxis protein CheW [Phenylobacterium sp.]MDP3116748.1 chemotaxis protein CheW [Phenylobacterium sp.]MDP3298660.1 chemotaxis protein CheW [Phenylobacterium sp.]MDP3384741.1 chemotaxis protein CheW [Phenylobacterium sp.]
MTGQPLATSGELITVVIGEQRFAIDIQLVREIRGWTTSTPLPNAPDYVLGVINLRGAVLPVLNLAARLGLPASEARSSSVVIVVDLVGRTVGLLVDAVSDIINVGEGEIQPAPVIGAASSKGLARGMITTDEGIITLIDMSGILPAPELAAA